MKLIIDIPDEMYDWLMTGFPNEKDGENVINAIKSGVILPKEHGRLGDLDAFERFCTGHTICNATNTKEPLVLITELEHFLCEPLFDYAPTIIKASTGGEK